jgi:hypothetical protein
VEQPKWDQMFFFYGDDRWLFTPSSALVIEYFNALQGTVIQFYLIHFQYPVIAILDSHEIVFFFKSLALAIGSRSLLLVFQF